MGSCSEKVFHQSVGDGVALLWRHFKKIGVGGVLSPGALWQAWFKARLAAITHRSGGIINGHRNVGLPRLPELRIAPELFA